MPEASIREGRPPGACEDEDLLLRARSGDASAFELLVCRHKVRLYNYIVRMTGNRSDAEDLFQETFLRVYTNMSTFKDAARFRPWLYRIATNVCNDYWRSWRRRLRLFVLPRSRNEDEPYVNTALSPLPDPREEAAQAEWNERLAHAVKRLPLGHRSVFLMARYQDMTYKEIAQTLEIPEGTVKSRMNKAVHQLMQELREEP